MMNFIQGYVFWMGIYGPQVVIATVSGVITGLGYWTTKRLAVAFTRWLFNYD